MNYYDDDEDDCGKSGHETQENLGTLGKIEGFFTGGWVLILLGAPFFVFEYVWTSAHWLIRLVGFILAFLFFCDVSKGVVRGGVGGVFSFPWYLPLAVLAYPTLVLDYMAPNAWRIFQVVAFFGGFPLGWKYYDYILSYKPWVWQCDNCRRRVRTEMNGFPGSMLGGGCPKSKSPRPFKSALVPSQGAPPIQPIHSWTLVYRQEDPSWKAGGDSGDE